MATAKKPTTKKAATTKASTTKKPAAKKATSKKPTTSKTVAKSATKKAPAKKTAAAASPQSFRVTRAQKPFMTLAFTRESVYWLILGVVVILFTLWIMKIQNDISYLYDQIEMNSALSETVDLELQQKQAEKQK